VISAIILAAGKSTRMGQPKMLMPWGETTVLGQVLSILHVAGIEDITLVTNSNIAGQVSFEAQTVLNDGGGMLLSLQRGLHAQSQNAEAALVCLGDQPQIEAGSVRSVCDAFESGRSNLVVPSYQMRRGHPWLIARPLWGEILGMDESRSMRDFLNGHSAEIQYVEIDSPAILQDLDTPADYEKYKPNAIDNPPHKR